jgi:acyl-CoA dehydrogenase
MRMMARQTLDDGSEALPMNFLIPAAWQELRLKVHRFLETEVIPLEGKEEAAQGLPDDLLRQVRNKARVAGLWTPHLPSELGGLGLSMMETCLVFEEAGRSPLGPIAFNCAAPDEGNMHLLHKAATPEQQKKYLLPLAAGEIRSCFAMTEPAPGAGSDPTMLQTRAEKQGSNWVINGRKWFTTGANGAAFVIVATVTDPKQPAKHGTTLFLVDAGTPGFRLVRDVPTMTTDWPGGHGEVLFENCTVPESQILGGVGQGFKLMQVRLGPARMTHCMRWLGAAQRAQEIAMKQAKERQAFGKQLMEHQGIQWMLADSAMDIHAARLMTLEAAWKLENGSEARQEVSMCKVFVAEAVGRVIDRAVQICGAKGVSTDLVLERLYRDARAFRIYDGPSEVHRMVIARNLLRGEKE